MVFLWFPEGSPVAPGPNTQWFDPPLYTIRWRLPWRLTWLAFGHLIPTTATVPWWCPHEISLHYHYGLWMFIVIYIYISIYHYHYGFHQVYKLLPITSSSLWFMVDVSIQKYGLHTNKHQWGGTTLQRCWNGGEQMGIMPFQRPYFRLYHE